MTTQGTTIGFPGMNHGSQIGINYGIIDNRVVGNQAKSESEERQKNECLSALWRTNPSLTDAVQDRKAFVRDKGKRVNGTCEWIRTNSVYLSWLNSTSQLLWLSGGPGKGKSMLAVFLAEELELLVRQSKDVKLLQYFCSNKDASRNTATLVLRGLLSQILLEHPKLIDHMLPVFAMRNEQLFTDSSFETLWSCFEAMVCDRSCGAFLCVLDGLDECDDVWLEELLHKFRTLFSPDTAIESTCKLRMIILSREEPKFIARELEPFPRIVLDPYAQGRPDSDIAKFIEGKVDELSRHQNYPQKLRLELQRVFWKRAEGSFLWVGIVAKQLEKHTCDEVKSVLDGFPSELNELYDRLLSDIPPTRQGVTARILQWVAAAIRPLTLMELSAAIGIVANDYTGQSCEQVIRDHVKECGYLLTITDSASGLQVRLLHQSVKDYLYQKPRNLKPELEFCRTSKDSANLEIARRCIDCLQNSALTTRVIDPHRDARYLGTLPLLSYAIQYWTEHLQSLADPELEVFDLSLPIYADDAPIRANWLNSYLLMRIGLEIRMHIELKFSFRDFFSVLHLASFCGISPLVQAVLHHDNGVHDQNAGLLNQKDVGGWTALHWAASHAHQSTFRKLVQSGADPNVKNNIGATPLDVAIAMRRGVAFVSVLLEHGAHLEASCGKGQAALLRTVITGDASMTELLLRSSPGVDISGEPGRILLCWAAGRGHETVVRLLLEYGAEYNKYAGVGRPALHEAVLSGHGAIARLLLERGADANIPDEDGRTMLHAAVSRDDGTALRVLLEHGMDPNEELPVRISYPKRTLLHLATYRGKTSIVQLLLSQGANPCTLDFLGRTALHIAAESGWNEIVRLLLEMKFDVNTQRMVGNMILHHAVRREANTTTRILFQKGEGPNSVIDKEEVSLNVATDRTSKSIAQLRLQYVNAKDWRGKNATEVAARRGHEETCHLLRKAAACSEEDLNGFTML